MRTNTLVFESNRKREIIDMADLQDTDDDVEEPSTYAKNKTNKKGQYF